MFKTILHASLIVGSVILPATVLAATPEPGTFTLTPQIGYYFFEGNQDVEDDVLFGLAPGYFLTRELAMEAVVQYVDTETDDTLNDEDLDGYLYHVDLLYHFNADDKLTPFVAAGLGGITLDDMPDGGDSAFLINYGAGLKYALTDALSLRGDVRHMVSFDDHYNNLAALVGITYSFGGSPTPRPKAQPVVRPAPVPPAPAAVSQPAPQPAVKDSDKDGVIDDLDRCPQTLAHFVVDNRGCPVMEEISVNLHVQFDHNKATIRPMYNSNLQEVGDFFKKAPNATAVIEGHTDSTGSAGYNQSLSQQRAEAVRLYLIENYGISPERLTAKGFGEEKPIASNVTESGRQTNRRVVATIQTMRRKMK
ncbi:MAG: OmpA family protein [Thermodesulfobacteriota bacterium]